MHVGDRIREARKRKSLTQKELGEILGVTQATAQQYESGKRKPKIETLKRIAKALGVPLAELRGMSDLSDQEISTTVDALLSDFKNLSIPEALIVSTFRHLNSDEKIYILRAVEMVGRANGRLTANGSKSFMAAIENFHAIAENIKSIK